MPNDLLLASNLEEKDDIEPVDSVVEEESSILVALRIDAEEEYLEELEVLKNVLTSVDSTTEEKNNAFEQMKSINNVRSEQEELESLIKKEYGYETFIKIDGNQIRVVVASSIHDASIANKIMRLVQSKYNNKMYITVKFQGV